MQAQTIQTYLKACSKEELVQMLLGLARTYEMGWGFYDGLEHIFREYFAATDGG